MTQPDDWIASQQDWAAWAANCSAPMADQPPYPYYGYMGGVGPIPDFSVPSTYQPDLVFMLLCVTGLTWAMYDHLITLSSEVRLVWGERICLGSGLFGLVRYFGLTCLLVLFDTAWHKNADNGRAPYGPLTVTCHGVRMILTDFTSSIDMRKIGSVWYVVFGAIDIMLQMRIYALYRNIRLVILNGAMFVTGVVAMVAILYGFDPVTCGRKSFPDNNQNGCSDASVRSGPHLPAFWIPALIFELWLAVLAIRKMPGSSDGRNLLSVIVHDSIKYFVLIAIGISVHLALSFCGLGDLAIPFVMASHTVGGSRLILHLRETYYDRLHPSMDSKNAALSFAIEEIQQQAPPFVRSIVDASFFVPEHVATDHDAAADGSST